MVTTPSRKLAVILHADVVGSTKLVRINETLAHQRIQDAFQRFSRTIASYGGIAHELRGDALLAEFRRSSDAVAASLAYQAENSNLNSMLDDEIRPAIRVGIAMGEVVIADNTITGDGVVLAQRLEQLAEPGGVCIHDATYQTMPKRLPFVYELLSEQTLKGFDEPVRAYRVTLEPGTATPSPENRGATQNLRAFWRRTTAAVFAFLLVGVGALVWWQSRLPNSQSSSVSGTAAAIPDQLSIAVLPFTNMSGHPEQEYFSDGITEDLITDLSKLSGLFVIARNSTFVYKGEHVDIPKIAQELGVRYVVEGSVRRSGDIVRVNAQLIDATTGGHIWAERYDGTVTKVFDLQDDVTARIVAALAVRLAPDEQETHIERYTDNPAAYDMFLKGWSHLLRQTPADNAKALELFEQAVDLDPNYSRAYAAMAQAYWNNLDQTFNVSGSSFSEMFANSIKFLGKARENPSSEAHSLAARMLQRQRRFDEAMVEAENAVDLSPSNAAAYETLIELHIYAGQSAKALQLADKAMELDPRFPGEKLFLKGMAHFALQQPKEAVKFIERARLHNPDPTRYAAIHAAALAELGRAEDAKMAFSVYRSGVCTGFADVNTVMLEWPFEDLSVAERLADGLVEAGLPEPSQRYYAVARQDRLNEEQIKSTLFGKTMIGTGTTTCYGDDFEVTRDSDGQIVHQGWITFFRDGVSRVERNVICDPWDSFGDYCVAIYQNPHGSLERQDDYLLFTINDIWRFSVVSPTNIGN